MTRERNLHTLEGAPLGPDSLLWKYMDNRLLFTGLSTGILQTMYKTIGKALEDHSNFVNEPFERVLRSMVPITETVFGTVESAKAAGAQIAGYHHTIKGMHDDGSRYHSMDPNVWDDTMLTFINPIYEIAEKYDRDGLTDDQKDQLYKECITWRQNFPITDRHFPPTYVAYKQRWNELCENEFRLDSDVARWTLDFATKGEIPRPNAVPQEVWPMIKLPIKPTSHVMGKLIIANIPELVRKKNDIVFSRTDQELVTKFENMIKDVWGTNMVPQSMKYPPQAYEAFKRERALNGETTLVDRVHTLGSLALKDSFGFAKNSLNKFRSLSPFKS
jgi:uncharacterized protein (DUF2236 family)